MAQIPTRARAAGAVVRWPQRGVPWGNASINKIWCVCFVVLAGCAHEPPAVPSRAAVGTDSFIATIARIKQGVALITCAANDATGVSAIHSVIGTAFFTSARGEFVTAAHVLAEVDKLRGQCLGALNLQPGGWDTASVEPTLSFWKFSCSVVDDTLDVGICRTETDLSTRADVVIQPIMLATDVQPDGTAIAFTGFPLLNPWPITGRGWIAGYRRPMHLPESEIAIAASAWPGASGAPVFISSGHVIGVVLATGTKLGAGLTYARPSRYIEPLLVKARAQPRK